MKLGMKVGLDPQSLRDIDEAHPEAAEVWFNIMRTDEYTELFNKLRKESVETGLHFWGALGDGTMANIAYPDTELNTASMHLMKKAINIAEANKFSYVNIHPGQRAKIKVNFIEMNYPEVSEPSDLNDATERFLENAIQLGKYARDRGIVFTVETVSRLSPASSWYDPASRLNPIDIYDLPIEANVKAAEAGIWVANDFVHTATHSPSDTAGDVWDYLKTKTDQLRPMTKLIHLGFLVPPYNGVDNHDMLDNPVFLSDDAIPNRHQTKELLTQFKSVSGWIVTEPRSDHAKNYILAKKLLDEC